MGDQFENFISKNRNDFEDELDGNLVWNQIEKDLDKKSPNYFSWVWKVAAMIFLATTIILSIDKFRNSSEENPMYAEFYQAELFYVNLITQKQQEISSFDNTELARGFLSELEELDEMYKGLKDTFDEKTSDQKLVNAMIANLQLRIQILNKQLSILQELNEMNDEPNIEI